MQVAPPTDESTYLQASVRTLASGRTRLLDERLQAVRTLAEAPALPVWERGLLLALNDPKQEVRASCLRVCRSRLARLEPAPEQQDAFLTHLLEACFTPHRAELSETYAQLLGLITDALLERPLRYEHHRSLLLLGATKLQFTRTHAPFAAALTTALKRFAEEGTRSDTLVVQRIQDRQKLRAYKTLGTPVEVLRIYLEADSALAPGQIGADLLEAYAALLAQMPRPEPVLRLLLGNLRAWLHDTPQRGRLPPQLLLQALRAAKGEHWDALASPLRRQLLVGQALAGGPDAAGDLLAALRNGYTYVDDASVAPQIMDLLARLPASRARIPELCDYLSDPGLQTRPAAFWSGALALIDALATGLAEHPTRTLFAPDMERLVQPQRAAWQIGARDIALRRLLERLAHNPALPAELRLHAWRTLLRTLPQDRSERQRLYAESLAAPDDARLPIALEAAAEDRQRFVWRHVARLWPDLIAGEAQTPGRTERLRLACRLYAVVRDPAAVAHQGEKTPPLLALALDDPDQQIRAAARQALDDAGLAPVLEYEEQRRRLDQQELASLGLEQEERELIGQIERGQQQLEQQRQLRQQLEHALRTLERKHQHAIDNLGHQLSLLDSERRSVETNLHTCENQLARQQQTIQSLDSRLESDSAALAAERDQIDQLIELQANLAVETTRLEGRYADLYSEREQVRRRLERLPEHSTRFQKHLDWMEWSREKLGHYERQIASNGRQVRLTQHQIDQARERHLLLTSGHETLQRDRRRHQRQFDILHGIAEQQRRKLSQVRVGIEQIHAEEQRLLAEHQQQTGQIGQKQRRTEQQIADLEREQGQLSDRLHTNQQRRDKLDAATRAGRQRAITLLERAGAAVQQADQRAEEEQIRHENARWVEQELFVCYCEACVMRNA
ncbi:MAG: hypothetical protein OHK0022_30960 [Roseiflexaceae bacterium]